MSRGGCLSKGTWRVLGARASFLGRTVAPMPESPGHKMEHLGLAKIQLSEQKPGTSSPASVSSPQLSSAHRGTQAQRSIPLALASSTRNSGASD